jgi:hypothetical protein
MACSVYFERTTLIIFIDRYKQTKNSKTTLKAKLIKLSSMLAVITFIDLAVPVRIE